MFFVRFYLFYFILFFNWDFFYILDILMHDIFGYSDFRVFPMAHHMPVYVACGNSPASPVQPARVGESGKF